MITNSNSTPNDSLPPLIKVQSVARLLAVSRNTVRSMIEKGELEGKDINHFDDKKRLHLRVTRESLLSLYQKRFGYPLARALENPFESEPKAEKQKEN